MVTLRISHWPVDRRNSSVNMATCTAGSELMRQMPWIELGNLMISRFSKKRYYSLWQWYVGLTKFQLQLLGPYRRISKNVTLVGKTCREVAIVMFPFELNDRRSLKLNVNVISVIVFNIFNSYPFGEPNKRFMNSGARCDICSTFRIPTPIETSLIRSVITWRSKLRNTYARQQETLTFR